MFSVYLVGSINLRLTVRKLLFVHGVRFAALLGIGRGSVHDLPGSRQLNVQQTIKNERCCGSPTRHNEGQDMFLLTAVSFANLSSESFTSESLPECYRASKNAQYRQATCEARMGIISNQNRTSEYVKPASSILRIAILAQVRQ
jgi:hypothetical protein